MGIIEEKRRKIIAELERGRGGRKISRQPVPLEPEYSLFSFELHRRSFLEKLSSSFRPVPIHEKQAVHVPTPEYSVLYVRPSTQDNGNLEIAEQLLLALPTSEPIAFEIVGINETVMIQMSVPSQDAQAVAAQILSYYPNAEVFEGDDTLKELGDRQLNACLYILRESPVLQIRTAFKAEPYHTVCGALSALGKDEAGIIQLILQKARHPWKDNLILASRDPWDPGKSSFVDWPTLPRQVDQKVSKPLFVFSLRILGTNPEILNRVEAFFAQYDAENGFVQVLEAYPPQSILSRTVLSSGMLLNSEEMGALIHLPDLKTPLPKLMTARLSAPPPPLATTDSLIILGVNRHRGIDTSVGITAEWLSRHMVCFGQTGAGKTTFLKKIFSVVSHGFGLAFIDPNGDAAEETLALIPSHRIQDVINFHPAHPQLAPALNILQVSDQREAEFLCSDILVAFERFFGRFWGPQTEMILRQSLRTLLFTPGEKFLPDVRRLLLDEEYRKQILSNLKDPDLLDFWKLQFPKLPKNACNSLLNKLSKFLDNRLIRPIISQPNSIDFQNIMETGKIFIANLSKGLLSEENAFLLGSFLLSKFQILTMARAAIPKEQRKLYPIIVDELHNFAETKANAKSLNSFFSEARKNAVPFIGATQYIDQLHESIRASIFGNIGTLVVFRCGVADSLILKRELGKFQEEDILNLGVGETLVRMGKASDTFNMRVLDTPTPSVQYKEEIIRYSYEHYYRSREEVEKRIQKGRLHIQGTHEEPISELSPQERFFLESAYRYPNLSVTRLYTEQHLSGYMGDRIKKSLLQKDLVREVETHLGKGSRVSKYLHLTADGLAALNVHFGPDDGKGGPLHRYWQSVIKSHAEGLAYRSTIEEPVPDSQETVDIGLEKDGKRIAIEVSITTNVEQELANLSKCFLAGYDRIIVLTLEESKMQEIQNRMRQTVPENQQPKVTVGLVYDFGRFL